MRSPIVAPCLTGLVLCLHVAPPARAARGGAGKRSWLATSMGPGVVSLMAGGLSRGGNRLRRVFEGVRRRLGSEPGSTIAQGRRKPIVGRVSTLVLLSSLLVSPAASAAEPNAADRAFLAQLLTMARDYRDDLECSIVAGLANCQVHYFGTHTVLEQVALGDLEASFRELTSRILSGGALGPSDVQLLGELISGDQLARLKREFSAMPTNSNR